MACLGIRTSLTKHNSTATGSYVPDLPGCVAVGETREEVRELIQDAIEFHLEDLRERGLGVPSPFSSSELVAKRRNRLLEDL